jgi:hypothetical protein
VYLLRRLLCDLNGSCFQVWRGEFDVGFSVVFTAFIGVVGLLCQVLNVLRRQDAAILSPPSQPHRIAGFLHRAVI